LLEFALSLSLVRNGVAAPLLLRLLGDERLQILIDACNARGREWATTGRAPPGLGLGSKTKRLAFVHQPRLPSQ
jgi:hypothetical protein